MKIQDSNIWQETITNYVNNNIVFKFYLKIFNFSCYLFSLIDQIHHKTVVKMHIWEKIHESPLSGKCLKQVSFEFSPIPV